MPMRSRAQRSYLWIHHPEIARRWEKITPKNKKLPEHVKKQTKKASFFDKISQKLPKNHNNAYYTEGIKQALAQFNLI